jgi:hypothetical protein
VKLWIELRIRFTFSHERGVVVRATSVTRPPEESVDSACRLVLQSKREAASLPHETGKDAGVRSRDKRAPHTGTQYPTPPRFRRLTHSLPLSFYGTSILCSCSTSALTLRSSSSAPPPSSEFSSTHLYVSLFPLWNGKCHCCRTEDSTGSPALLLPTGQNRVEIMKTTGIL